jgi:glycosyltransferase involved in cell wall biosynthesis
MAKILILIGAHLCMSPRPQKEAEALASAGHDVLVRGFWFDHELAERDRRLLVGKRWQFEPIIDFRARRDGRSRFTNFTTRLRRQVALELFRRCNYVSPEVLGYGVKAMLLAARQTRADLTIVHSEGGLWVGSRLLDEGFNVGVDFEDWFSEDLLPQARRDRPVHKMKMLEKRLIRDCSYRLTTSHSLAAALAVAYDVPEPMVVYNVFPFAERKSIDGKLLDRRDLKLPSLYWFSQTIGPGRGLETLFAALKFITLPAEVHLRGNCDDATRRWVESLIPAIWKNHVFLHTTVESFELLSRIAEHDIGLALERPNIPSRNLTVTNKLFQYLQGGLAIVATDTAGQKEIFDLCSHLGQLTLSDNPPALAGSIEYLLQNRDRLAEAKNASLHAARKLLSWEIYSENLLRESEKALDVQKPTRVRPLQRTFAQN